jgi:hypothetical protein
MFDSKNIIMVKYVQFVANNQTKEGCTFQTSQEEGQQEKHTKITLGKRFIYVCLCYSTQGLNSALFRRNSYSIFESWR